MTSRELRNQRREAERKARKLAYRESRNAVSRVIIPGEDPAEFEALLSDLLNEHAPANETESLLVQQMAQSWWLMQRAIRLQTEIFTETEVDTRTPRSFSATRPPTSTPSTEPSTH